MEERQPQLESTEDFTPPSNGGRKITVQEAQIKTAEIQIKTLTIGRRQVTLNVFRQLEPEDLINLSTGELNGIPWGRVNYWPKPCKDDHFHVVWQKGEELRRACVHHKIYNPLRDGGYDYEWRGAHSALLKQRATHAIRCWQDYVKALSLIAGWKPDNYDLREDYFSRNNTYRSPLMAEIVGTRGQAFEVSLGVTPALYRHWKGNYQRDVVELAGKLAGAVPGYPQNKGERFFKGYRENSVWLGEDEAIMRHIEVRRERGLLDTVYEDLTKEDHAYLAQARRQLEGEVVEGVPQDRSLTDLKKRAQEAVDSATDLEDRWRESYQTIADLDQLFIAT